MTGQTKLTLLALAVVFAACSSGGTPGASPSGSATLLNWPAGQTGTIYFFIRDTTYSFSAPVNSNGQFSYNLPTPPSSALSPIGTPCPGVTTSNPSARGASLQIEAQIGSGSRKLVQIASSRPPTLPYTFASLLYSDSAFSINGSCPASGSSPAITFNASFAQGWNWLVTTFSSTNSASASSSNTLPNNLNWYYDYYDY